MSRATLVDLPPEQEKAEDLTNEVEETQLEEELPEAEQPQEQPALPEKY